MTVRVAAVQDTPVFLDRDATIAVAVERIGVAAGEGAQLVVFSEAFVPGYPDFVWRVTPFNDEPWVARLIDQAVEVPSPATEELGEAAARHGVHVAIGVHEREGSTLYNSIVYFGPDGAVLGVHRKLVATGGERLVWGMGDGSGLAVHDTEWGRLGGLICWENYMPLARAALYSQGIDVYVAPTWDNSDAWVPTLRHIAKEGRVHVIGVTSCQRESDVLAAAPGLADVYPEPDAWISRGNTTIVGPDGGVLAGPLVGETGILYADLDLDAARVSRRQFDPVGHYARPDVLRLTVDRRELRATSFEDESLA
jgi:nitrilase